LIGGVWFVHITTWYDMMWYDMMWYDIIIYVETTQMEWNSNTRYLGYIFM
jgi:hypothetical protein